MEQKFDVTGMTCAACSAAVNKSVAKLEGVKEVNVNLLTNSMAVTYEESLTNAESIVKAVEYAGYHAAMKTNKKKKAESEQSTTEGTEPFKEMKYRLTVSFCFLVPLMTLAMLPMFHHWLSFDMPVFLMKAFYSSESAVTFAVTQLFLLLPILYVNRKYYQTGFKTLFHFSPNMDSLIALGSTAAVVYSIIALYKIGIAAGQGDLAGISIYKEELYFESAGTILTLITLGKYFEARAKGKTTDAIKKLVNMAPKTANVLRGATEVRIPIDEVQKGDIVIIRSGEAVPVDGIILEGDAAMDESAITGESVPVDKLQGDRVITASMNRAGFLKVRAEQVGEDTTLARIIELVEEAASSKAPIAKLADKISGIFVPIVIGISIIAFVIWLISGAAFSFALSVSIAVLVIACPCALGLATPVAIMVGTGRGAANGILIKSAESLEGLHKISTVVLDKTGTITEGKPVVTDILPADGYTEAKLLTLAASIELLSGHPLAEAVVRKANEKGIDIKSADQFQLIPGQGIRAVIDQAHIIGGNLKMMQENAVTCQNTGRSAEELSAEGKTVLHFAKEGKYAGMIAVADQIKPTSKAAIAAMKELGLETVMLTGDNLRTAEAIRKKLSIDKVIAQVLPEDKEREIRKLQAENTGKKVAMVGDGINDAPALMRADVGIAIGAGTDVAIDAADIVLMKSDLTDVVTAIELSRATMRNIKQNLFWAFFYNITLIPLAAGALYVLAGLKLNPMIGAAAMGMSSVSVVSNALRLRFFKPGKMKIPQQEEKKATGEEAIQKTAKKSEKETDKETDKETMQENSSQNNEPIKGDDQAMKKEIIIEGMMCDHCKGRVEKALQAIPGVQAVVDLDAKKAVVSGSEETSEEILSKAVADAGYEVISIQSV